MIFYRGYLYYIIYKIYYIKILYTLYLLSICTRENLTTNDIKYFSCISIDSTFTSTQTFVIFKHIFRLLIFVTSERKNLAYATYLTRNEYTSKDDKFWCYIC